ncbi:Uncharacterized protein-like protein [Ignicoccus hospitalis KIN4/I]|uniref:Uncharacterized protein-like protein n=2 Tax=Ignicoccus TaxID=54258 RepID=A8ABB8_IGNH4|nr:Uncharacterized protein-like protein [Ignicoccus hospitalis KIN4/I]
MRGRSNHKAFPSSPFEEGAMRLVLVKYDPETGANAVVIKGDMNEVVRQKAIAALKDEWKPESKDFMIMGDFVEFEYELPLTPEQYEALSKYDMRKEGKVAVVKVPYFVITFPKYAYQGSPYVVYLVAPYLDEEKLEELKEMAEQVSEEASKPPE